MIKKTPIKVIHMAPLGPGGISKLTITIHKLIDKEKVQIDYLVFRDRKEFFEEQAIALGGKKQIINTENMKNEVVKFVIKMKKMIALFKTERYDIVHVDASTPYDVMVALAAKIAGVKTIVMHSHNDDFKKGKPLRDFFMPVYKFMMLFVVTDYFTISEKAAKFMFPTSIYKGKKYQLVRNGIDTNEFSFSDEIRKNVRHELGVENKTVIGHIGRFVYQKNHEFIIKVFAKYHNTNLDSVLLLVGEGELLAEMKKLAKELGVINDIIFYGVTHDVRRVLLAMDLFIFPSRFEGLGIVAIEAQTNGLLTLCADSIVDEANVTDRFCRVHGWDYQTWANKIGEFVTYDRAVDCRKQVVDAGYDIRKTVEQLQEFYVNSTNREKQSTIRSIIK